MFEPVLTLGVLRVAVLGSFLYSLAVGFLRSFIAFTLAANFPQVLLIQMVDNVFSYVQQPALEALAVDVASKRRRGRAYGALNMIPGVALTVSPILGALIWEAHGADRAFYSSALFSATAAVVLLFFLQEPEKRED